MDEQLYDKVRPYIDRWVSQGGRNADMKYGVNNFMTGQGMVMLQALLATEYDRGRIDEAKASLTSTTIELALSLIGEDEPVPETAGEIMSRKAIELEERRDKCKVCAKVAANEVSWQKYCRRHIGESWRSVKQNWTTPTGLAKSRNELRNQLRQSLKELVSND